MKLCYAACAAGTPGRNLWDDGVADDDDGGVAAEAHREALVRIVTGEADKIASGLGNWRGLDAVSTLLDFKPGFLETQ